MSPLNPWCDAVHGMFFTSANTPKNTYQHLLRTISCTISERLPLFAQIQIRIEWFLAEIGQIVIFGQIVHEMVVKGFHTYFLQRKLQEIEIELAFFEGQINKMLPNRLDWHCYLAGNLKRACFLRIYSWISCINLVWKPESDFMLVRVFADTIHMLYQDSSEWQK